LDFLGPVPVGWFYRAGDHLSAGFSSSDPTGPLLTRLEKHAAKKGPVAPLDLQKPPFRNQALHAQEPKQGRARTVHIPKNPPGGMGLYVSEAFNQNIRNERKPAGLPPAIFWGSL